MQTNSGTLFTEPCEAIYNNHPQIHRCALVGTGEKPLHPVIVAEPWPEFAPADSVAAENLAAQLRRLGQENELTRMINDVLIYPKRLPTDIRHNSKIFREQLAPWAERQLQPKHRALEVVHGSPHGSDCFGAKFLRKMQWTYLPNKKRPIVKPSCL